MLDKSESRLNIEHRYYGQSDERPFRRIGRDTCSRGEGKGEKMSVGLIKGFLHRAHNLKGVNAIMRRER